MFERRLKTTLCFKKTTLGSGHFPLDIFLQDMFPLEISPPGQFPLPFYTVLDIPPPATTFRQYNIKRYTVIVYKIDIAFG